MREVVRLDNAPMDSARRLLIITGAGASRNLGAGKPVPLMSDWNRILIGALDQREQGLSWAVGLSANMNGPQFEDQVGRILEWSRLPEHFEGFGGLGIKPFGGQAAQPVKDWIANNKQRVDSFIGVLNRTLFEQFGANAIDDEKARSAYSWIEDQLQPNVPTSLVLATTNYDPSAKLAFEAMGYTVRDGFSGGGVRTPRYDPKDLGKFPEPGAKRIPLLHLHGAVGWYQNQLSVLRHNADLELNEAFGIPLVLHPDPKKHPDSLPQIRRIWDEFRMAVSAATHILILGHSLNDPTLVDMLRNASAQIVVAGIRPQPSKLPGASGFYCSFGPDADPMMWVRAWLIQGNSALPAFVEIPETLGPDAAKTSTTVNFDDQVVAQIDFEKIGRLLVHVSPAPESTYWRFGLGFSSSAALPASRSAPGFPLWHLTKNGAGAVLNVDYYDEFGKAAVSRMALDHYRGEPVTIEVGSYSSSLDINVYGTPGYSQRLGLSHHRFARLFGWADNHSYSLYVAEEELARGKVRQ
jgi:hypothetical protein